MPAGGQRVVSANSVLGNGVNNSAVVTASTYVLAERFMSFDYHGGIGSSSRSNIPGATEVVGSGIVNDAFYFAEGTTTGNFAEYLTIENPEPYSASVAVTYLPASGAAGTTATYTVAANSRYTVNTSSAMPNQSFAMVLSCSSGFIVAERSMYFQYAGTETGGTDVIGFIPNPPVDHF